MEFFLQKTDIFDEDISRKFNEVIINNNDIFKSGSDYEITVSFHVDLLTDIRFQDFNIGDSGKRRGGTNKDKIYDVLRFQLRKLEQSAVENGIEVSSFTIQGDLLEEEKLIKIEIIEDTSRSIASGKGKQEKRMKVTSIIPSLPNTRETVSDLAGKTLNETYGKIGSIIRDKSLLSEILEIEETDDENILFKAFVKQYGEYWLSGDLAKKFKEKSIPVIEKRIEKQNSEKDIKK